MFKTVLRKIRREVWKHFDNHTCFTAIKGSIPRQERHGRWKAKLVLKSLEQYVSNHFSHNSDTKSLSVTLGIFLGKLSPKDICETKDELHTSGVSMLKYYQGTGKAMSGIFKSYSNEKLNSAKKISEIQSILKYFDEHFSRANWKVNELKAHSLIMRGLSSTY